MCKIRNLFDSHYRPDGQLTVIPVNGGNTLNLHKTAFFEGFRYFSHIFVAKKHLYHDGIGKIRHRKNQNGLLIADFSLFHIQNLSPDHHFAHFSGNDFQGNGIFLKVPSVEQIRILFLSAKPCRFFGIHKMLLSVSGFFLSLLGFFGARIFPAAATLGLPADLLHFLIDHPLGIPAVFTLLHRNKFRFDLQIHAAALAEHLFQIFHKHLAFFPSNDRIRQRQMHGMASGKRNGCALKQTVLQHIGIAQFQSDALAVCIQKIFRRILRRKMKFLDHCNFHGDSPEQLSFHFIFQTVNIFFMNPFVADQINPQMSLFPITGNPGYFCRLQ